MNLLEQICACHPDLARTMTQEQKKSILVAGERLHAIDLAVKAFSAKKKGKHQALYWHLRELGFTNDDIWIYSPHIGGEVGADEPEWV